MASVKAAYFGNGVCVTLDGIIRVDYRSSTGERLLSVAKPFRQSLQEAMAYAEVLARKSRASHGAPANGEPRDSVGETPEFRNRTGS